MSKHSISAATFTLVLLVVLANFSCDCQRKNECEWALEVDEENMDIASPGFTSLCLKNFKLGKQKCFLEIEDSRLTQIKEVSFRYDDIEIDGSTMPRRIKDFVTCTHSTNH